MKNVVILAVVVVFIACQNKSEKNFDELEKMSWLVGEWENKMPDGILTETWTKANDSTFTGKTLFIRDKDTLHSEEIVLTQKGETLLYIPTVKGQNDNKPVEFKITESKIENEFAFENPKHDYPQKIVYKKVNETNLVATISGKQQGKSSSESYPMKKK
ncbi:MAG: DUF6265 family protein [Flavobacterium sp.]|jgi:Domain of unknown function (DUF6265)|uniref:DUF6265 family protein n=1 Tax=Flavobacterium TaxID=237 RepID=UPI0022C3413A|nr:DUF6265 family protein [Flavobacterium sp.]MCZ8090522.1 DUF6265 family protein [Flavobacterium sp.]MCZ8331251.1 DUF6265 family protein [Flavobacterium sp.]